VTGNNFILATLLQSCFILKKQAAHLFLVETIHHIGQFVNKSILKSTDQGL